MSEEKKEIEKQAAEAMRGLFHEFRYDIDELTLPILMDMAEFDGVTRLLIHEGKAVGFLMVVERYIEGIYVQPEYRRKGIARNAVLEYIREHPALEPQELMLKLHIVNTNKAAKKFWFSIFDMHKIDKNPVDTFYEIHGLKERWRNDGIPG